MTPAVAYYRSSKDRAEMGVAAQRAELKSFAASKELQVVQEFSDMEISGSLDETSRPGLRQLLAALNDPARKWKTILALDTSRIARDPMLALYVTHEAEKRGVTIQYAKMPIDGSSAFGETMLAVVRAFDRFHARMSAEKGRGGQIANFEQGFRAGGKAPFGYKLKKEATGGSRGGVAISKSTLVPDPATASKARAFLEARAAGVPRQEAARRAKINKATCSLMGIERNALTYAGYGVWNMRKKIKPTREDPRKGMTYRPRAEWKVTEKPIHEALITREQAERILATVDWYNPKPRGPLSRQSDKFILSGLLFTPEGKQWHGDSHDNAYRAGAGGKRINAPFIEGAVIAQVAVDMADSKFLQRVIAEARRVAELIEADPGAVGEDIQQQEKRLANLAELAATGSKTIIAKIQETEAHLAELRKQQAEWAERKALKQRLLGLTEAQVAKMGAAVNRNYASPAEMRGVLMSLVERAILDPKTQQLSIKYRLTPTGVKVGSPWGFDHNSGVILSVSSSGGALRERAPAGQLAAMKPTLAAA